MVSLTGEAWHHNKKRARKGRAPCKGFSVHGLSGGSCPHYGYRRRNPRQYGCCRWSVVLPVTVWSPRIVTSPTNSACPCPMPSTDLQTTCPWRLMRGAMMLTSLPAWIAACSPALTVQPLPASVVRFAVSASRSAFPCQCGFHAILKLNDKLVQLCMGGIHAAAPANVGDIRVVRIAVIIGQVAQHPGNGRADNAPIWAAHSTGRATRGTTGSLWVRAFIVRSGCTSVKYSPLQAYTATIRAFLVMR